MCFGRIRKRGTRNAHHGTIRHADMVLGPRDLFFLRIDHSGSADVHARALCRQQIRRPNGRIEASTENGCDASNSQGCCEPASAAASLKQSTSPTSCKTPRGKRSTGLNTKVQVGIPQSQFAHKVFRTRGSPQAVDSVKITAILMQSMVRKSQATAKSFAL